MHILQFCIWLQHTGMGKMVRVSPWLFPTVESFHIIGLAFLVGSIARLDVRLLGLSKRTSVSAVAKASTPWALGGFALAVTTGFVLFSSEAESLFSNRAFRLKMLLLLLLGVNAAIYELLTRRNQQEWDTGMATPNSAKLAGGVSLILWLCVIVAGRWIAYA